MTLEQLVTSLELSKKLKELGVPQKSIFDHKMSSDTDNIIFSHSHGEDYTSRFFEYYPAFTSSELGEMLKEYVGAFPIWDSTQEHWVGIYTRGFKPNWFVADTEANARAKMLIYLIEQKLVKVDEL